MRKSLYSAIRVQLSVNKRGQALIVLSVVAIIALFALIFLFKSSSISAQVAAARAPSQAISPTPQTLPVIGATPPLPPAAQTPVVLSAPSKAMMPPRVYKTTMICPKVLQTRGFSLPLPGGKNDCDLVGKGKDIDEFLTAMENRAAACKARRADVWKQVLAAKADLDKQVDALQEPPPGEAVSVTPPSCQSYTNYDTSESLEPPAPENQHYTHWLKTIEKDVNKYCGLVDELMKPMWTGCDEINFYRTCEPLDAKNRAKYHKYIAIEWGVAQKAYDYTDSFYSNALQTAGWGNFKKEFNEDSLKKECPSQTMTREASLP